MKIGKPTYIVISIIVLLFACTMLFFRLHIPGEAQLLAAVKQAEQQYGADNLKVVTPLSLLSNVYVISGHPEKAVDIYKRIVDIDIKHAGLVSPVVISSKHQLAVLLDSADEVDEADTLYVDIHKLEQQLAEKAGKSEVRNNGNKTTLNPKAYKPMLRLYLQTRIASLKAKMENSEPDEQDSDMLQRYQRRLKMLN